MIDRDRHKIDIDLHDVRACEDVEELLDIRAESLRSIIEIEQLIEADNMTPRPDVGWQKRVGGAMRFQSMVARTATARLLAIAPEELASERANDPPPSVTDLQNTIARLTSQAGEANQRNAVQQETIARLQDDKAGLAAHIAQHVASADDRKADRVEMHRLSLEAGERSRVQKIEAQRARDEAAGQRFIDAARGVLHRDQYLEIWRVAGMDEKGGLKLIQGGAAS
jgi:hypothetical protein